jgi:diaminohydroxyphosphoribosylaminopyrimidine deaminase/5-amino-6-(5-phosphoribosylamino)uracil reductase
MPQPCDRDFMQQALRLARKGAGRVSPNPMVGAVVVRDGAVVGTGYHRRFGGPHAEVYALRQAGARARGAHLYVTLEPCSHTGKTPPCTDAVIASGVARVSVGMRDPNPLVSGRGIARLRRAGIWVQVGLLQEACRRLNEAFVRHITCGVPWVVLKAAMSLDGRIATRTGDSRWISCERSRRLVHRLRAEADAVMVGVGTVIADDPQLTVRLCRGAGRAPLRVVVDSSLRTPLASNVLRPDLAAGTMVATTARMAASDRAGRIRALGAEVVGVAGRGRRVDLQALMRLLGRRGVAQVMLEGGAELNASALAAGIVDKVMLFYAPRILGGRSALGMVGGTGAALVADGVRVRELRVSTVGADVLVEGYVETGRPCGSAR